MDEAPKQTVPAQVELKSQGYSTRGNIAEGMSNTKPGAWKADCYAGDKQPEPMSPGSAERESSYMSKMEEG